MMKTIKKGFNGWSLKTWLIENIKTVKELSKAVLPGVIGWLATYDPTIGFFAAGLGKLALDTLEYWVKQQRK